MTFTADISELFDAPEPMKEANVGDSDIELRCFRAAADEAGYLTDRTGPIAPLLESLNDDICTILYARIEAKGALCLLLEAEEGLSGSSC